MIYKILDNGVVRNATPQETAELDAVAKVMPTEAEYTAAIQSMLDTKVKERRYDSIISACTYATCSVPPYQKEGQACVQWRGSVWAKSEEIMDKVLHGELPQPTIPELLEMLPQLEWPT